MVTEQAHHEVHVGEHAEIDYERQDPNSVEIIVLTVLGAIVLYGVIVGLEFYYNVVNERLIETKIYSTVPTQLRELRSREDEALSKYKYIDESRGIVQIPIDRAIELLVKEGDKPREAVPVAIADAIASGQQPVLTSSSQSGMAASSSGQAGAGR
ncbi:MAG: hypothetical protein RMM17_10065 [Acidobacteriota bacterium]|nr:hypothetical protein [Blastocatellia bacterium]MDW8413014.1 hypothetical protein [Acidobacteriota bacterium]